MYTSISDLGKWTLTGRSFNKMLHWKFLFKMCHFRSYTRLTSTISASFIHSLEIVLAISVLPYTTNSLDRRFQSGHVVLTSLANVRVQTVAEASTSRLSEKWDSADSKGVSWPAPFLAVLILLVGEALVQEQPWLGSENDLWLPVRLWKWFSSWKWNKC